MGGKGSRGLHVITPSVEDLLQVHLYVLNNSNEVLPYIVKHEKLMDENTMYYPPLKCFYYIISFL